MRCNINSESLLAALLQVGSRLLVAGCDVGHVEYKLEQMCLACLTRSFIHMRANKIDNEAMAQM